MDKIDQEKYEKKITVTAALGVGFVCIIVGLPLWWKTTTVYRVQLPYAEISELVNLKFKTTLIVNVVFADTQSDVKQSLLFQDRLSQSLEGMSMLSSNVWVEYKVEVGQTTVADKEALLIASSVEDLDKAFQSANKKNVYDIVLLPKGSSLKTPVPIVGKKKISYIPHLEDLEQSIPQIVNIAKNIYMNEAGIIRAIEAATGAKHQQSDKESMRKIRSHSGYQLTFTLLNPQPDIMAAKWDVPSAVKDYLDPLLKSLEHLIDLRVKSQYLHYLGIGMRHVKDKSGENFLKQKDLPHIINPIEAYLGSHVSTDPELNFIVYVPTRDQSPLKILDMEGKPTESNSFLIPRWGGFMVYNTELPENTSLPSPVNLDMKKVMQIFVSQIKLLLGISTKDLPSDVKIVQPGNDVLSQWELDFWLRSQCVENIATSIATLNSLADLLEKISNMVINDHIGNEVQKAVKFIHKTHKFLKDGNLREAYMNSKHALTSSEKAFFDQSLLELLYFPEDQKFAIYIPLFLPIGIPILMSVMQSIKYLTKKPEKTKTE